MSSRFVYSNSYNYSFCLPNLTLTVFNRAMFVWVTLNSEQDPLFSIQSRAALINFCIDNQINTLFLDMYNYLGSSNYSLPHVSTMQSFISEASSNNIEVYALAGATDWSIPATYGWIETNIINKIIDYNSASSVNQKFSGFILDVEYWLDAGQTSQNGLSGLCNLIVNMKSALSLPVAVFSSFYLQGTGRPNVTYNSLSKSEAEHLMDVADFVVVGAYRDTAEINLIDDVAGQIGLFEPWYNYAIINDSILYMGVETNSSLEYDTFFEETKSYMEEQLLISKNYFANKNIFIGQAIHSYDGWKVMAT